MAYARIPDRFPVLRGDGLTLRELDEADLPAWFARLSDAEAARLAGDPIATSIQAAVEGLAYHRDAFRRKEAMRWAIVPEVLGTSVGSIGLGRFAERERSAGLGGAVGRAHWGQRIATRAARLVIDYAFRSLGLERLEADVLPENARVRRLLDRLGFELAPGPCPDDRTVGGRADSLCFVLFRGPRGAGGGWSRGVDSRPMKAQVPTDEVKASRIGLVADTHSRNPDGSDLPQAVLAALEGVDLILHLGDMGAVGALDRFAAVAPVLATRGGHAVGSDPRIAPRTRVVEASGFALGALFELPKLAPEFEVREDGTLVLPDAPLAPLLEKLFGRAVDVVAFAATHAPFLGEREGVLFVNPGSPNLPSKPPGTVAIVDLSGSKPAARIRQVAS